MIRLYPIALACVLILSIPCVAQAQDTVFNRVVTVERDYQPEIEQTQAITTTPTFIQYTPQLNPVVYSTYSNPLSIGYNLHALPASSTKFSTPTLLNGVIEGALGYRNTHMLFAYQIKHKKKMSLDLYANHDAYWGKDALAQSILGMLATRHFSGADFYFGLEGQNEAFAYQLDSIAYNAYFPWRTFWNAQAKIGVQSTKKDGILYRIQTGYNAFFATNHAIEHQVRSYLDFAWKADYHKAGINASVLNAFYTITDTTFTASIAPRHAIHLEPFYEFHSKNIRLHAGVNLDINLGNGQLLSGAEDISFAPSPNVEFEWHMMDNLFHLYANAHGYFDNGSLQEFTSYNRYLNLHQGLTLQQPRNYTPIDAQLGFKIRPVATMLIDIYGGYAYMMNAYNMKAILNDANVITDYHLWFTNYQRWKVGASMHYHYRDILELNVAGNYYFWTAEQPIYDRPNWDIKARLDVHIDSKWSIYSDNYFAGSRLAHTTQGDQTLAPIILLNIGGQYAVNRWLVAYLQLNDYLHRRSEYFYGYHSQGIHFLAGVKFKF